LQAGHGFFRRFWIFENGIQMLKISSWKPGKTDILRKDKERILLISSEYEEDTKLR
jgi:hypothetical protein